MVKIIFPNIYFDPRKSEGIESFPWLHETFETEDEAEEFLAEFKSKDIKDIIKKYNPTLGEK